MSTVLEPVRIEDPLEAIPTLPEEPEQPKPDRREILLRAAEVVEERGLATATWESESGAVCLLGAIGVAMIEKGYPIDNRMPSSYSVHAASEYFLNDLDQDEIIPRDGEAWAWSDQMMPRLFRSRQYRAARALRRLADGASWRKATR